MKRKQKKPTSPKSNRPAGAHTASAMIEAAKKKAMAIWENDEMNPSPNVFIRREDRPYADAGKSVWWRFPTNEDLELAGLGEREALYVIGRAAPAKAPAPLHSSPIEARTAAYNFSAPWLMMTLFHSCRDSHGRFGLSRQAKGPFWVQDTRRTRFARV